MPITPTTPPLWVQTFDLTSATIPPGATLSQAATGGGLGPGTVTSVDVTSADGSIAVTGSPITTSGTIDLSVAGTAGAAGGDLSGTYPNPTVAKINTVALGATTATAGNLLVGSGTQWVTKAVSGDATMASSGALTLANTAVTPGSYGDGTHYMTGTVDSKGRLTAAGQQTVAFQSLTTTGTSGAATLSGGVLNIPQYSGGGSSVSIVTETNTTRTAILTDANSLIDCTNNSGCTITIPPQSSVAWGTGAIIYAQQSGTLQASFAPGSGVTFDSDVDSNKTRAKGSIIAMQRKAADVWTSVGDVEYDIAATSVQANATNATAAPTALAATADGQRLRRENGVLVWEGEWAAAGGTSDAITVTIGTSGTLTLQDGALYGFRASAANATTTPTLAINGGTARTITKFGNVALSAGDIYGAGHECLVRYVSSTPRFELLNPAASSGSGTSTSITQTAHGFSVGNLVRLSGSATYTKALADSAADAEVVGIVSLVLDSSHFTLTTCGYVTGLSGLTANTVYFLDPSTAGAMTATEPTTVGQVSKPLLIADTTTSGYFFNMRGEVVTGAAGTGYFGCKAYNDGTQSIPNNASTAITFASEEWDTNSIHSTSTNTSRFTVPPGMNGRWRFIYHVYFAANATNNRIAFLRKNGGTDANNVIGSATSVPATSGSVEIELIGTATANLVATDYVELYVYQNSGGSLNVGNTIAGSPAGVNSMEAQYLG